MALAASGFGGYAVGRKNGLDAGYDAGYAVGRSEASAEVERALAREAAWRDLVDTLRNDDAESSYYRAIYDLCYMALVEQAADTDALIEYCRGEIAAMVADDWYGDVSPGWSWEFVSGE